MLQRFAASSAARRAAAIAAAAPRANAFARRWITGSKHSRVLESLSQSSLTLSLRASAVSEPKRHFASSPGSGGGGGGNLGSIFPGQQQPGESYLDQFTVDLTKRAADQMSNAGKSKDNGTDSAVSKMDPIIGRHDEIRRCLQILARRTKNNPCLIGEAGVGKTAIAEGIAQRIVSGQVPESMKNKRVLSLDVAALVSGAMMRGQFEDRLKGVIKEVTESDGEIILFIDEIHTMVGAGKAEGGLDMANILKPALARGELQLLGATTLNEFRLIEKDSALARRLQSVYVKEPSIPDTLSILRGLKPTYELHHAGIRIKDEALIAAATLSDRYITDRFQPDKSIDLVDEACSRLRLEQESKPEVLWNVERDLLTKQIELSALDNEVDPDEAVLERKAAIQKEVDELKKEVDRLTKAWQEERRELTRVKQVKEDLAGAQHAMDVARRAGDYAKAGELLHSTIPKLQEELRELEEKEDGKKSHSRLLAKAVTADAIATIVARHTGIPVSKITGNSQESKQLLNLESKLRQRVVGQDHALTAVADCVRLARTRLQAQDRTLGNFLFLGPTGVGKTELCKALAEAIFDDQHAMTRIDMSEYGEKHTVSRLIGAPPGYIGYDEGGILTESVRRRPYQVILLDEFEKGHPDVWNLLLQLFDDGQLTDSHGRKVDFTNVIVVMTSNMGASVIAEMPEKVKGSEPQVKEIIMDVVRKTLSPELINRIDETIVFNRLQREHMTQITDIGLSQIAHRLADGQHMTLDVSDAAKQSLASRGFDVRYGARPLRRTLTQQVLNPLSRCVLDGTAKEGDVVRVRTRQEALDDKINHPKSHHGWVSGAGGISENPSDVVIMKNHEPNSLADDGNDDGTDNYVM